MQEPHKGISGDYQLENGRLLGETAGWRIYNFMLLHGPWPDVGGSVSVSFNDIRLYASLIDRRGPLLTIAVENVEFNLAALSVSLILHNDRLVLNNGHTPKLSASSLFLDSKEGWTIELTGVSGDDLFNYKPSCWPEVQLKNIIESLEKSTFNFIWRQSPRRDSGILPFLAKNYLSVGLRVLILGDCLDNLNEASNLEEALFTEPSLETAPLNQQSVYRKIFQRRQEKNDQIATLHQELNHWQSREASVKAKQGQWDDFHDLENRFRALAQESELLRLKSQRARADLIQASRLWEESQRAVDVRKSGMLGWFKKTEQEHIKKAEECKNILSANENTMAVIRRQEEHFIHEAEHMKERLTEMRQASLGWPSYESLSEQLLECKMRQDKVNLSISELNAEPVPGVEAHIAASQLILTYWGRFKYDELLQNEEFDIIIVNLSQVPDFQERANLAKLAAMVNKKLIIMSDFSFWPLWTKTGQNSSEESSGPAWQNLLLAEEFDPEIQYLAFGGLFAKNKKKHGPHAAADLIKVDLSLQVPAAPTEVINYFVPQGGTTEIVLKIVDENSIPKRSQPKSHITDSLNPCGLGLRAYGEIGPSNPVSALMAARMALRFTLQQQTDEPAVIIFTPSPSQTALVEAALSDIKAPLGRIFCDEPQNFNMWNKVPLVIIDPAFEAPHLSHPWAWPSFGRQKLLRAWSLAKEKIYIIGRNEWLKRLSANSPLAVLWHNANTGKEDILQAGDQEEETLNFWEALDKAKKNIWVLLPAFEAFWWRPLEEHFLAAARRKAAVTIITAVPNEEQREYAAAAIRTLSSYGCTVHIGSGFPGILAAIDEQYLCWGYFKSGQKGPRLWNGLQSACLPSTTPLVADILQLDLINKRLGRKSGGLKTCPQCGWPLVLVNQEYMKGYGDDQPLKIACMGTHANKVMRRLDARNPFLSPPKCNADKITYYQRMRRGRHEYWVCPNHPDGENPCPIIKTIPGDAL